MGCTSGFYKRQADKDVYAIIETIERDIFGSASEFSVNTAYSRADPKAITSKEILDERSEEVIVTLTLDEAIDTALNTSRRYQTAKEQLYLSALSLTGAQHEFRPQFFAGARATGTRQGNGEKLGTVSSDIGVGQMLLSGANLGVNIANDLLRFYTGDPRRSAVSTLSFNIVQPLLRGAGREVAAENLTQAHRDVVYAIRDFAHFQNEFAVDVVNEYFRVLQAKDTVFNQYNNYLSRQSATEYLRARALDRAAPLDVDRAEQNELSAKNSYINAIARFRDALDAFKISLGLPQTTDLRLVDEEIQKLRRIGPRPVYLHLEQGFRIALDHRLPLMNEIDQFEDAQRRVTVAANQLKADLDIFSNASLNSDDESNRYERFNFDDVRADLGIQLNLPLDRLRERNNYRATLIRFESAIRTLGQTFDEFRNTIARGIRDLDQLRQNYEIQVNAVALAERRVEGTRLQLQAGTAIFNDVSDAQDDLILAQNAVSAALISYQEARLNLFLELGVLNAEIDEFWLRDAASKLDLTKPAPDAPPSAVQGAEIIPPDQLFQTNAS